MTDNPQDPAALAKEANTALRLSQNAMMSGKHDQAAEQLAVASQALDKLKQADPAQREIKTLEQKLQRQQTDLERRKPKQAPASTPGAPSAPAPAAASLPVNFIRRLKMLSEALDQIEDGLKRAADHPRPEEWLRQLRASMASATSDGSQLVEQIGKNYFKGLSAPPPELEALLGRTAEVEQKIDTFEADLSRRRAGEAETRARQEALCNTWVARLAPYVTGIARPGHDPKKYLIAAGTSDPEELNERKRIWEEASGEFALYRQAEFPDGKTELLQDIHKELEDSLAEFEKAYVESLGNLSEAAEKELDQARSQLAGRSAWRDDPKLKPLPLSKSHLERIQSFLDQAAQSAPDGDARLAELRQKYAALLKEDEEVRQACVERTFMTPDRFSGTELEELRAKAAETAMAHGQGAETLRITVTSPSWNEEDVIEYTDTTRTEIRRRVTHSVNAQAAVRLGSETLLYTIHIARDRRADGSFGPLRGHVNFSDRMLGAHVDQSAP